MQVKIRKPKLSDARELHQLINDPEVIGNLWGYPYPCPLSRMKEDVQNGIKDWTTGQAYAFTILADDKIAGSVVLEDPNEDKGRYEIGIFIGKDFWNKGVGTKAIKQAVEFGFQELNLYKIQADTNSDRPASGRIMEKAGFRLEGVRPKAEKRDGQFVDLHMWGVTK
ncbi:MAG TPA: GNAT family N-acetyltransferase [Patescibacteria group bacterium]|nr:GNAT family N-acetyltransferase [Patescibacteria group bacterium]